MPRNRTSRGRVHIVLIPGFAGFDALGQLEYYAGVTPQFQQWKNSREGRREDVALHYFDNFPTAAVRTAPLACGVIRRTHRTRRIRQERLNRTGWSFHRPDPTFVGCCERFNKSRDERLPVMAAGRDAVVQADDILRYIDKVVFLSSHNGVLTLPTGCAATGWAGN